MADILTVENLGKRYGRVEALRGVDFTAGRGEIVGLLGPNGAGKTTTIDCIVGLRRPDHGRVTVCDIDALAEPERMKQRVGVAMQSTALHDKITPREALGLFGSFYDRCVEPRVLIDQFALNEKADAPFASLSAGQRQRLALALAFVNQPELIFLDEPTGGLDPQARRELHADIRRLRAEGRSVVLTTHYIEEAETLCDRVGIIDHGRVIASGTPAELVAKSNALPEIVLVTSQGLDANRLRQLPKVVNVRSEQGCRAFLKTTDVSQTRVELLKMLLADTNELVELHIRQPSLEDVFIELTGSALRN
jgi:ABC-2 type transport system ATP-binding protein